MLFRSPTFKILDAIEGYDPVRDAGLYLRRTIDVIPLSTFSTEANPIRAFVYLFNRFEGFPKARKIRPWFTNSLADFPTPNPIPFENNSPLFAIWPDPDTIVPQSLQDED